jgi:ribosomal protein S12 methylthiotransferase accessory factor
MSLSHVTFHQRDYIIPLSDTESLLCLVDYADSAWDQALIPKGVDQYLYLYLDHDEAIIGPLFDVSAMGCPACLRLRRKWNARENEFLKEHSNIVYLSPFQLEQDLLQELAKELLCNQQDSSTGYPYYRVDYRGHIERFHFWPMYRCPNCTGEHRHDDIKWIELGLNDEFIVERSAAYRYRRDHILIDKMFSQYNYDSNFIIYQDMNIQSVFSIGSTIRIAHEDRYIVSTGTGFQFENTRRKSYYEAMERLAGTHPRGREQENVWGDYASLQKTVNVWDPRSFLDNIIGMNQRIIPFSTDLKTYWIEAYSWKSKTGVFIPESLAYYKYDQDYSGNACMLAKGNSNGNALGGGILDSVYYACLEIIERDAFLNHWYLRRTPTRLDIDSVESWKAHYALDRLSQLGYEVTLFDITMETKIPTIWAFAMGQTELKFATYSTCAANHHPEEAILLALQEMLLALEFHDQQLDKMRQKAEDVKQNGVRELDDHPLLYTLPSERSCFDFLNQGVPVCTVQQAFTNFYKEQQSQIHLKQVVHNLLDMMYELYGDILIVRQTPEGFLPLQLECVKVIVPGMQQLWFGEQNRHINPNRIQQVGEYLGINEWKINEAPHPFP